MRTKDIDKLAWLWVPGMLFFLCEVHSQRGKGRVLGVLYLVRMSNPWRILDYKPCFNFLKNSWRLYLNHFDLLCFSRCLTNQSEPGCQVLLSIPQSLPVTGYGWWTPHLVRD